MNVDYYNMKISVIVPIYKIEEEFLRKCIESLINQTYKNIEIILVDDGSPDKCPQICDEYALKDDRIIVIHKKNAGTAAARNDGLDVAAGEYITFVDADDRLDIGIIESAVKKIIKTGADMIWFDVVAEYSDHNDFWPNGNCNDIIDFKSTLQLFLDNTLIFSCWGKLISRHCINNIKFIERLTRGQDGEFIVRILLGEGKSAFCHEKGYYYNLLSDGVTRQNFSEKIFSVNDMINIVENEVIEKYPDIRKSVNTCIAYNLWLMVNQYRSSATETKAFEERMLLILKSYKSKILKSKFKIWHKFVILLFMYVGPERFKKIYRRYKKLKNKEQVEK